MLLSMKDPDIEKRIRLIELFLDNWKKLHELMAYSLNVDAPEISMSQERKFTEVRSYLLEEYEHIFNKLGLEKSIYSTTKSVLITAVSMHRSRQLNAETSKKVENEWNEIFTNLEIQLGQLKVKKSELAKINLLSVVFNKIIRIKALWAILGIAFILWMIYKFLHQLLFN